MRFYSTIFPWGISITDIDGKIISVNEKLCELLKETRERIQNTLAEKLYVKKEDRERLLEKILKDEVVFNFETEIYRADGTKCWINLNMKKIKVEGKERLVTLVEDITEIKKALSSNHRFENTELNSPRQE